MFLLLYFKYYKQLFVHKLGYSKHTVCLKTTYFVIFTASLQQKTKKNLTVKGSLKYFLGKIGVSDKKKRLGTTALFCQQQCK